MPFLNWLRRVRENISSNQPYDTTFDDLQQVINSADDEKPAADDNGAPDTGDADDNSDFDFDSD